MSEFSNDLKKIDYAISERVPLLCLGRQLELLCLQGYFIETADDLVELQLCLHSVFSHFQERKDESDYIDAALIAVDAIAALHPDALQISMNLFSALMADERHYTSDCMIRSLLIINNIYADSTRNEYWDEIINDFVNKLPPQQLIKALSDLGYLESLSPAAEKIIKHCLVNAEKTGDSAVIMDLYIQLDWLWLAKSNPLHKALQKAASSLSNALTNLG